MPNLDKSCLFSTDPDIRRALRGGAFPVADSFKDLGVIQTPTGLPNVKLAKARDQGGNDKLVRTGMVPVPFGKRCQIAAASGVPSALYGTSVQAITNQRLCSLRAAATAAIWRSPGRLATEVLYGILAPFRADPLAGSVVRPWLFLTDAIDRGVLQLGEVQWLWTAGKGSTGPLACAKVALRRAGVSADAGLTQLQSSIGGYPLWRGPSRTLRDYLLSSLRAHQFMRLSRRRPLFKAIGQGVDRTATLGYLRDNHRPEVKKAALRVLMTGGTVTQSVASKWVPGGKLCPHCKLADETLFHRLWHCPRWQGTRLAELQGYTLARLQQHFCNDTVCTGLVPSDALCLAAAATERAVAAWPAPVVLPGRAWSDGSALDPHRPHSAEGRLGGGDRRWRRAPDGCAWDLPWEADCW